MGHHRLFLESGPRRRTTMVHALDLLGCTVRMGDTDAALAAAPAAIAEYAAYLQVHGEVPESGPVTTEVAEHVTSGPWLGYGDPEPGFSWDFLPLDAEESATWGRRLAWLAGDIAAAAAALPPEDRSAAPDSGGRPVDAILEHVAEAQGHYVRYLTGRNEDLSGTLAAGRRGELAPAELVTAVFGVSCDRFAELTALERSVQVPHGRVVWTARRALRRSLEHAWEHLREVRSRDR